VLSLGFLKGVDDYALKSVTEELHPLQALLSDLLGTTTTVKIVELTMGENPVIASIAETKDRAEREAKAARLKQGREHETIKQAAAILGAEIEDVRDLGGTSV